MRVQYCTGSEKFDRNGRRPGKASLFLSVACQPSGGLRKAKDPSGSRARFALNLLRIRALLVNPTDRCGWQLPVEQSSREMVSTGG